jgi:hypothetical protein
MAFTTRLTALYALVFLSIATNVNCSQLRNVSAIHGHSRHNSTIPPPTQHKLPPLIAKPPGEMYNEPLSVVDDFMPTLNRLLAVKSIRSSSHPRRALSLKLLTLLLQDDEIPPIKAMRPVQPPPTTRPIQETTWTPPPHAAVGIDLIWSGSVHSTLGKPAIWKDGFAKAAAVAADAVSAAASTDETVGTTTPPGTRIKDFSGNDVPQYDTGIPLRPGDASWVGEPIDEVDIVAV